MNCPYCGREISETGAALTIGPFKVLFDEDGSPKSASFIRTKVANFSEKYDEVVREIIADTNDLDKDTFMLNAAKLLASFKMTRNPKSMLYGVKVVNGIPRDPKRILEACWAKVGSELAQLRRHVNQDVSSQRSRALLELPQKSRNYVFAQTSLLFDRLEWISMKRSNLGPVAASKILFTVLPEIALPVDNSEWKNVFKTHNYSTILTTMTQEIKEWEKTSKTNLETLDSKPHTTLPSIYNVMAMNARP